MPHRQADTELIAYRNGLKMLAVQMAGQFPGNREDAEFILEKIQAILFDHVFDEEPVRVVKETPPRLTVVPRADHVS